MTRRIGVGTAVGPYRVTRELPESKGGMARVYVAERELPDGTRHQAALKVARVTDPEDQEGTSPQQQIYYEALNNEVECLKILRHPNIVKVYPIPWGARRDPYIARATELAGRPWFFIMEYLTGGPLSSRIGRRGLPLKEAVEIAYQVCLALEYIHSKEIAHLDLKPDNVLFRYPVVDGGRLEPVLIDFGIAARTHLRAIDAGSLAYTPPERLRLFRGELAPEQLVDQRPVDVYCMGLLLYRMLTGRLPFVGRSKKSITTAILNESPTRPSQYRSDIKPAIEGIILAALQKDPSQRPKVQELSLMLDEAEPSPRWAVEQMVVSSVRPSRSGWGQRLATGGLVCFALISLVEFGLLMERRPQTPSASEESVATSPDNIPAVTPPAPASVPPTPTAMVSITVAPSPTGKPVVATPTPTPWLPTLSPTLRPNTVTPIPTPRMPTATPVASTPIRPQATRSITLITPDHGMVLTGPDARPVFSWRAGGSLRANEYYVLVIEFPHRDGKWYPFEQAWTKATSWGGTDEHLEWFLYNGDELAGSRERRWYVVIKQQTGSDGGRPVGQEVSRQSDRRMFIWQRTS